MDAGDPGDEALDPHAEAGVGHAAVLADVEIPLEGLLGEAVLPDPPELTKGLKLIPTDLSLAEQSKQLAEEFRQTFQVR